MYGGPDRDSPELARLCNRHAQDKVGSLTTHCSLHCVLQVVTSQGSAMLLVFTSDGSVQVQYKYYLGTAKTEYMVQGQGFTARYRLTEGSCGGRVQGDHGTLTRWDLYIGCSPSEY